MVIVVITGFMGTGKTSVGRALAAQLERPFVDTDALIESSEGSSVTEIFATDGEAHFRAAEKRALAEALEVAGAVVATGGGAVLDPDNLAMIRAAAPLVCLTAPPEVIVERTKEQGDVRPLLHGHDPRVRVEQLLAERAEAYAKADLSIDTSSRPVADIVDQVARFLEDREAGA
jgi:shikimate kinase